MEDNLSSLDFTGEDWEVFYDTVDSAHFQDKDADLIYQVLEKKMKLIDVYKRQENICRMPSFLFPSPGSRHWKPLKNS